MSRESQSAPGFAIIRVRTNGPRPDGSGGRNKYSVDVEVQWGIFPVQIRGSSGATHLSMPLRAHPAHKSIMKDVTRLVKDLEAQGRIGQSQGAAVVEIAAPSADADERTRATVAKLSLPKTTQ